MEWIVPKRGGRTPTHAEYAFKVGNHSAGGKNKTKQSVILISEKAMKELRWVIGDKVVFSADKNTIYLKRVTKDGFALSSAGGKKYAETVGKMARAVIKTTSFTFPEDATKTATEYIIQDGVVIFSPK